jgi:hypothetical protein
MLRKTMIVLAKPAALTSGLTVEAFAHFGAALGLALFGLVLASFAGKAAGDDEQGRKACMHDALTVCAKFIPEREQIANCLMANRERISQSCRLLLAHAH